MTATLKIEGLDKLTTAMRKEAVKAGGALDRLVNSTAVEGRRRIIKRYKTGPKTGRIYKRRSKTHQASAAGEAPAVDTGALISSVYFTRDAPGQATFGSRLAYAFYLEFGVDKGTRKIAKRPAWVPVVQELRPMFTKKAEAILRKFGR